MEYIVISKESLADLFMLAYPNNINSSERANKLVEDNIKSGKIFPAQEMWDALRDGCKEAPCGFEYPTLESFLKTKA